VPGSGCDHRCRHRRNWPDRVRGERVESFRGRVGSGFGRFGGGFVRYARVVADVRAYGYTRVGPDTSDFADTQAFRCR
jgi:hypothetical protein